MRPSGALDLRLDEEGRWLERRWSDGVAVDRREASPPEAGPVQAEISDADAEALVGVLDRDGSTAEIDIFPASTVFQEEGDANPWVAAALLEVDGASGCVQSIELGRGSECERWALEHLVDAWRERGSKPWQVVLRERTAGWLGEALERLGIEVVVDDRLRTPEPEPARDRRLTQLAPSFLTVPATLRLEPGCNLGAGSHGHRRTRTGIGGGRGRARTVTNRHERA
jgi:hypothetical protein